MRLTGRHHEQHRTTWDVPQKNAASDATRLQPIHHDAVRAIDEYLPLRATALPGRRAGAACCRCAGTAGSAGAAWPGAMSAMRASSSGQARVLTRRTASRPEPT
ncbi:hypothetical protein [Streptomyces sp. NPDC048603]|uniref:hypothetical protein n=1 Tax=Streptomyces sp. NPDC048603 TaxID=3365577 RepID=UPI00370F8136